MKKIFTFIILLSAAIGASAQENYYPLSDKGTFEEIMRSMVILLMVYLVTTFILSMIRLFLDHQLKRKIVETGTSEGLAAQLIPSDRNERKNSLRWFCILCAITVAFGIIGFYQPAVIYDLMIISGTLAIGFLCYFLLISRLPK